MKNQLTYFLISLILITTVQQAFTIRTQLKSNNENNNNKNNNNDKLSIRQDSKELMKTMFTTTTSPNCVSQQTTNQIGGYETSIRSGSNLNTSRDFSWIKDKWGYGQNCYVFDFFDPILGSIFITEAKKIYKAISNFSADSYKSYTDPFITDTIDTTTNQSSKNTTPKSFKENYNPEIYALSVNAVQIKQAIDTFKWNYNSYSTDPAIEFIQKYDINGDTRLSPRELILGVITENKKTYADKGVCYMCFESINPIIDSIFSYMDCDSDGYLSANDIMTRLPKLKRNTAQWNIFIDSDLGVRTKSINDFILVNNKSKIGELTLEEFRIGLYYGFWNRQTSDIEIISDGSKSLRNLRWDSTGLIDKELVRYKLQLKLKEEKDKAAKEEALKSKSLS